MSNQAFALRADYEDTFVGGTLAYGAGQQTFNVGEELQKNGGAIVVEVDPNNPTDGELLIAALDNYDVLKRIPMQEGLRRRSEAAKEQARSIPKEEARKAVHGGEDYDEATLQALDRDDLLDLADKADLDVKSNTKKDDIIAAILEHQKGGDAE